MNEQFKRSLIWSSLGHLLVFLFGVLFSLFSLPFPSDRLSVTWVELPRGTSEEIDMGLKKSPELPKTTIEEQKLSPVPKQEPLKPALREPAKPTSKTPPTKPAQLAKKPAPKTKPLSAEDRKIQEALKNIDKALQERGGAPPEAAQIKENGEGFKYGTGTTPVRVNPEDAEYLKYQAEVRTKIINEWIIPPVYDDGGGRDLNAKLEVMITVDGELSSVRWNSRSGDAAFDASAIRAMKRAAPLPKPPDRLAWEAYNEGFLIEFDPRLKNQ